MPPSGFSGYLVTSGPAPYRSGSFAGKTHAGSRTLTLEPALSVFRAVVATVVPEAEDLDSSGWRDLEALVDGALRQRPASLVRRLRLFLRLIEWLPVARYGRRFSALDPGRRRRVLAGLQESRLGAVRVGFWGLRTLALMGYYGRDEAARAIGYSPRPEGWDALG